MDKFDTFKDMDECDKAKEMNSKIYEQQIINKIAKILEELPLSPENINETELVQAYVNKKSRQLVAN